MSSNVIRGRDFFCDWYRRRATVSDVYYGRDVIRNNYFMDSVSGGFDIRNESEIYETWQALAQIRYYVDDIVHSYYYSSDIYCEL